MSGFYIAFDIEASFMFGFWHCLFNRLFRIAFAVEAGVFFSY